MENRYNPIKPLNNLKKILYKECDEMALIILNGSWEKWLVEKDFLQNNIYDLKEKDTKAIFRRFLDGEK